MPDEKPQWRRTNASRSPLLNKLIKTLTQIRDAVEEEVVRAQEELNKARESQGGRRRG